MRVIIYDGNHPETRIGETASRFGQAFSFNHYIEERAAVCHDSRGQPPQTVVPMRYVSQISATRIIDHGTTLKSVTPHENRRISAAALIDTAFPSTADKIT